MGIRDVSEDELPVEEVGKGSFELRASVGDHNFRGSEDTKPSFAEGKGYTG